MDALLFTPPDIEEAEAYLREIAGFSVLSASEERTLIAAAQSGDEIARERLLLHNLKLVVKIAKHFHHHCVPLIDLIQEGTLGLMHAVDKFDLSTLYRFSTYASPWITQAVSRYLDENRHGAHLPNYVVVNHMNRIRRALSAGAESVREIAEHASLRIDQVELALQWMRPVLSLDAPLQTEHGSHRGNDEVFLADMIADHSPPVDELADQSMLSEDMARAMECLSPREQEVIALRFGIGDSEKPHTLFEIGRRLRVTRERARQIEAKALEKLRSRLSAEGAAPEPKVRYLVDGLPVRIFKSRGYWLADGWQNGKLVRKYFGKEDPRGRYPIVEESEAQHYTSV
jgi:RNA polymerase primary sigma factor